MNKFETVLLDILKGLLVGGQVAGPIFVHSAQGFAVPNASEEVVSAILQAVPIAVPTAPYVTAVTTNSLTS